MEGKLTVVARIHAKLGKEDEVKRALLGLVAPTRAEAGCINYDLHQSPDDPGLFLFYENWQSRAALDAHLETPHLRAVRARTDELLVEPVKIEFFCMASAPAK